MISSAAELETMPRKLRPRGRRLASQGLEKSQEGAALASQGLEESQEGAAHDDPAGVDASAGGMELEATLGAIHVALIGNQQMVWVEVYTLTMQCGA